MDVLLVVAGLAVLAKASDVFVLGAARLAVMFQVSPIVVGAVVIGFGTGAPELLVSVSAAARGATDIGVGNVVGSNLANLTLVLGAAGLLARPEVLPGVVRREAPLSLAAVVLFAVMVQGGLTRVEGVVLIAALVVALVVLLRSAKRASVRAADEPTQEFLEEVEELVEEPREDELEDVAAAPRAPDLVRTALGLVGTVVGAQLLVVGAQGIATDLGLSGGFVGLTIVAIGTSLPELVTAAQAARRNETALIVGNVLGSNIFNSLAVGGAIALVNPAVLDDRGLTVVAAGVMVVVALLAWLFLALGGELRRWEAGVLLAVYFATVPLMA